MSITSTDNPKSVVFLTRKQQRERWRGIAARTLKRWGNDPDMALPPEYDLNGAPCRRLDEIEQWERNRIITEAHRRARALAIKRIPVAKRYPTASRRPAAQQRRRREKAAATTAAG